jgi:hypothetical protein
MSDVSSENDNHSQSIDINRERERDRERENEELKRQIEELKNAQNPSTNSDSLSKATPNRLSFISDFLVAIMSSLVSSHNALSANFGGGIRGAVFGAIYQSIFIIGLSTISYITYITVNSQEQSVYIPNEENSH